MTYSDFSMAEITYFLVVSSISILGLFVPSILLLHIVSIIFFVVDFVFVCCCDELSVEGSCLA
jgi:hypothetical protein